MLFTLRARASPRRCSRADAGARWRRCARTRRRTCARCARAAGRRSAAWRRRRRRASPRPTVDLAAPARRGPPRPAAAASRTRCTCCSRSRRVVGRRVLRRADRSSRTARLIALAAQIMANDAQHEALIGELLYHGRRAQGGARTACVQGVAVEPRAASLGRDADLPRALRRDRRPRAGRRAERVLRDGRLARRRGGQGLPGRRTPPPARCATRSTAPSSTGSRWQIEDAGLDLGAIYHSHTRSAPVSVADRHQPRVLPRGAVRDRRARRRRARGPGLRDPRRPGRAERASCEPGELMRTQQGGVGELVCPGCGSRFAASERFCPDCALPLVHDARRASRGLRAPPARAQDQAAAGRGRARPRRRGPQPGRGRVHPGAAARGGRAEPAAPQRRLRRARLPGRRPARRPGARLGRRHRARGAAPGRADRRRAAAGRRSSPGGCWLGLLVALALGALVVWLATLAGHA